MALSPGDSRLVRFASAEHLGGAGGAVDEHADSQGGAPILLLPRVRTAIEVDDPAVALASPGGKRAPSGFTHLPAVGLLDALAEEDFGPHLSLLEVDVQARPQRYRLRRWATNAFVSTGPSAGIPVASWITSRTGTRDAL